MKPMLCVLTLVLSAQTLSYGQTIADIARQERARQTFIAQIDFTLRDRVPNEFVRVNPLGLQISYFRVDQAFEEGQANGR